MTDKSEAIGYSALDGERGASAPRFFVTVRIGGLTPPARLLTEQGADAPARLLTEQGADAPRSPIN